MTTVFTPTYNRAYILPELYKSLQAQTNKDFEWLVVDDGSTDDTESLFDEWIKEPLFPVRYIKQENGGKHRAINRGVKDAKGELFFIVDSDDQLSNNAVERILYHYKSIKDDNSFCGVCGLKSYFSGEKVGGESNFSILDCNSIDFRYKHKIDGDMAEVVRLEVMKEYPFPEIEEEKFCPEALFWNRIAIRYKFRYFYEKIYLCEYLPDGLTSKITKIRMQSPIASMIHYSELYVMDIPYYQKIKAAINYWRFSYCTRKNSCNFHIPFVFAPIGVLYHWLDKRKYK
ncbi:MAG: glycosyltransferase family A protein [Peptostreptococcaceae bacterium]